jgi:enterochelin esterase-like enzyme
MSSSLGSLAIFLVVLARAGSVASSSNPTIVERTLRSKVFENTRTIRFLLPPGYDHPANHGTRYPVFYFLDGIAAFDAWGLPEIASRLWSVEAIPAVIFVGIDNGGSTLESTSPVRDRASEYLPYPDSSWTDSDAPVPRGHRLAAFLFDEVMPLVDDGFRTDTDPRATGLAGDSYAGAAAIHVAMEHSHRFGFLLAESPSLHIGDGRLLQEARRAEAWPKAIYLGVGTSEGDTPDAQAEMLANVRALHSSLERKPGVRIHLEVAAGGAHDYVAWRERLPIALRWLLGAHPGR